MPNQATARALELELVGRLAKFFPQATPVRIPIKLSRTYSSNENGNGKHGGDGKPNGQQNGKVFFRIRLSSIETPDEALFMVDRPLEFADHVIVESNDGSLRAEASVVAVQYHPEPDRSCGPFS